MRSNLLWKLLALNVPIVGLVIAVIWLTMEHQAADYFTTLMEEYNIEPVAIHRMFLHTMRRYLIEASIVGLLLATGLGFLLIKRMLRPLTDMAAATRRLAAGDYRARVDATGSRDEVAELAHAFNQMADSLQRIEKLRRTMVTDIAHELRTPLTNIRGYLEGLADGVVPPSKDTFDLLQQEILRLVRLVEDLQKLSQAEASGAHLRRERTSLEDVVERVLEVHRHDFEAKGIEVGFEVAAGARFAVGDPDALFLVVRNLVQNAAQYTSSGGRVWLRLEAVEGGVRLSCENTGEGIADEHLPYIFERFYRAEPSRSRDSGGAGVGLAIVKGLVEAHGGQVGATSDRERTRIWVSMPA